MGDDTVRLSLLWQLLRRRWRFFAVVAVLSALLGAGAWVLITPGYRTSTHVLLQGERASDQLLTESQLAKSSVVLDNTAAALAWHPSRDDLERDVSAEVGDGNVIVITGTADTPERAQQLTDELAKQYVDFSTQLAAETGGSSQALREQREALAQEIAGVNERITQLQAAAAEGTAPDAVQLRSELEQLRTSLNQAMSRLDDVSARPDAGALLIIGSAERPTSRSAPTQVQLAAGGALVAVLLGVFGNLIAARRNRRLHDDEEIGAALGAPVLAAVDVPHEPDGEQAGRTSWLRALLLGRQPWYLNPLPAAGDESSRQIRYRRALARLRGDIVGTLRVLVVVPEDDEVAHRAAAELGAIAAAEPHPIVLYTADVAARRPTVPDSGTTAGVLVVLTTDTRTGWELVGLAEACADAGQRVLGVVVAYPASPVEQDRAERAEVPPSTVVVRR